MTRPQILYHLVPGHDLLLPRGLPLQPEIGPQYGLRQAGTGFAAAIRTHSQLAIDLPVGVCHSWHRV